MNIKALVPVRSGSMRVSNKNIRPFCDSTLLEEKLKHLLAIEELSGVVVNSNDDHMLEISERMGAETVKRDPHFASNSVSMSDVYVDMAENMDCEHIMFANVTNPLCNTETYRKAISQYHVMGKEHDSLASAAYVNEFLWLDGKPTNYDVVHQPRSQDLPPITRLTFAFCLLPRSLMIARKNVIGEKPMMFVTDEIEAVDIDTNLDFFIAEALYRKIVLEGRNPNDILS
ncbi:cytidylyltransferase [Kiritimatiellaeota bacterium B1221]|nr:cytidylyltransferase [Kiritimatiellaeota bacterium B1221]